LSHFFATRKNANLLKQTYKQQVALYVFVKNYENEVADIYQNVAGVDEYAPNQYSIDKLMSVVYENHP